MDAVLLVALATLDVRAATIDFDNLPIDARWRYQIYCQSNDGPTHALNAWASATSATRPDIEVTFLSGRGVAASRNAALASCETELLLFTDDDVRLMPEGLTEIIRTFSERSNLDLFVGQTLFGNGEHRKRYPATAQRLTLFNSARIGTVELAVRPRRIVSRQIAFDLAFGAGQVNFLGDEYIFVADCLKAGLEGAYAPVPIAIHSGAGSALDYQSERAARARARVFERVFGPVAAPLIKLAFIWHQRHRFASLAAACRFARYFMPWEKR